MYDAEARAILRGLDAALNTLMARVSLGLHICLDNLSVIRNAKITPKGASQEDFKWFCETAKNWVQIRKKMLVN